MFVSCAVGGIMAAILAIALVADQGWRIMFWIGVAPLILVLPLAYAFLPDAEATAARYGVDLDQLAEEEPQESGGSVTALFRRNARTATVLFGAASFCGLLLVPAGLGVAVPAGPERRRYRRHGAGVDALVIPALAGALLISLVPTRAAVPAQEGASL